MSIRTILNRARAKATLCLMSRGQITKEVSIGDIPNKWESFLGGKEQWVNVELPESEDTRSCLFKAEKKTVFKPHRHKESVEHVVITNRGGKVRVTTDSYIRTVCFPDAIFIEKNEPHAFEFLEDTTLLILWTPKTENGWEAVFKDERE